MKDRKMFLLVAALVLCLAGIVWAVVAIFLPDEPAGSPALSTIMHHSGQTTIEKRNEDGTISQVKVNSDPVFRDAFSEEDLTALDSGLYNGDDWLYRVTYYMNEQDQVVIAIGPTWLAMDGKLYTMPYIGEISASLNGLWDYYATILEVTPGGE